MNEPFDEKPEDEQISALYQKASAEQPPAHLDDAVLAAAKREVRARPEARSPFSTRWTLPFSLAAVIVLSVSIVTLVQKESPREIPGNADQLRGISESASSHTEEKMAKLKGEAEVPRREAEFNAPSTANKMQPSIAKDQSRRRLAKSPAPLLAPPAADEARPASSGLPAKISRDETAAGSAPQPAEAGALAGAQSESRAKHLAKPRVEEKKSSVAQATESETTVSTVAADTSDQSHQAPSDQALAFQASPIEQQKQLERAAAQPQPPAPETAIPRQFAKQALAPATEPAELQSCASLSARDCLQSPRCTFVLSDVLNDALSDDSNHRYLCRDAANRCEQGFMQLHDDKEMCENKPGCKFIPGHCDCPTNQPCDCQGKNPPQCTN